MASQDVGYINIWVMRNMQLNSKSANDFLNLFKSCHQNYYFYGISNENNSLNKFSLLFYEIYSNLTQQLIFFIHLKIVDFFGVASLILIFSSRSYTYNTGKNSVRIQNGRSSKCNDVWKILDNILVCLIAITGVLPNQY